MSDDMHPNWRALATVNFPMKRFVKATEDTFKTDPRSVLARQEADGENIFDFYNDLLADDSETVKVEKEVKKEVKKEEVAAKNVAEVSDEEEISVCDPDIDRKLFSCVQAGDLDAVELNLKHGGHLDAEDRFGWSPLMIAAGEGNEDMVVYLLGRGAHIPRKDKSGRNAADIARKKGHLGVENLIRTWKSRMLEEEKKPKIVQNVPDNFESCDVCNEIYHTKDKLTHQASLPHQLELDKSNLEINPGFIISQTNKGYQLLKKGGWDGVSGLGDQGKGRLFPVKSVIKSNREGVKEGVRKAAKITHFAANDVQSIREQEERVRKKKKYGEDPNIEISIRSRLGEI